MTTLSDFAANTLAGRAQPLSAYANDVVLIVNTASKCGFTPQYEGLEKLYTRYKADGFSILGFPCNQFNSQEPGDREEITSFCQVNYGVSFPMFEKIDVNGEAAHPLYKWLCSEKPGILGARIKWNFTKFLVDRSGTVINRYSPITKPEKIAPDIETTLKS